MGEVYTSKRIKELNAHADEVPLILKLKLNCKEEMIKSGNIK